MSNSHEESDYERGLREAWDAIDKLIVRGPIEGHRRDERNGMVLACNAVAELMGLPKARYAEDVDLSRLVLRLLRIEK